MNLSVSSPSLRAHVGGRDLAALHDVFLLCDTATNECSELGTLLYPTLDMDDVAVRPSAGAVLLGGILLYCLVLSY